MPAIGYSCCGPASSSVAGISKACSGKPMSIQRWRYWASRSRNCTLAQVSSGSIAHSSSSAVALSKGRSRSHRRASTMAQPTDSAPK
jgi:hypothetical protein